MQKKAGAVCGEEKFLEVKNMEIGRGENWSIEGRCIQLLRSFWGGAAVWIFHPSHPIHEDIKEEDNLQEVVDCVLQVEVEVAASLIRPEKEKGKILLLQKHDDL